jgi:hypothetical protein
MDFSFVAWTSSKKGMDASKWMLPELVVIRS